MQFKIKTKKSSQLKVNNMLTGKLTLIHDNINFEFPTERNGHLVPGSSKYCNYCKCPV